MTVLMCFTVMGLGLAVAVISGVVFVSCITIVLCLFSVQIFSNVLSHLMFLEERT